MNYDQFFAARCCDVARRNILKQYSTSVMEFLQTFAVQHSFTTIYALTAVTFIGGIVPRHERPPRLIVSVMMAALTTLSWRMQKICRHSTLF